MPEILFPIQCLTIAGLLALAAHRGGSFPLKLTFMYAAFFYLSHFVTISLSDEYQVLVWALFSFILFDYAHKSKRSPYIDMFCLAMILAIINYILLYVSYIALSGNAYEAASHVYTVASVMLSIADIVLLAGVINGTGSTTAYDGLGKYITNGLSRIFAYMEAPQAYDWPQGSTYYREKG